MEPGLLAKFGDWIIGVIGALLAVLWTFLKSDINRAHKANETHTDHINELYRRAEVDRADVRQTITDLDHRLSDKLDRVSKDMLTEIRDMIRNRGDLK